MLSVAFQGRVGEVSPTNRSKSTNNPTQFGDYRPSCSTIRLKQMRPSRSLTEKSHCLGPIVGSGGNTLRSELREVQQRGDWAYDTGRFIANAPDGSVLNSGKWIVIWQRQLNGDWKIHGDFFHWDIPPKRA